MHACSIGGISTLRAAIWRSGRLRELPLGSFDGLSAFPPTPADAAGRLQEKLLAALIGRIAATQADSIGLLGSTGGYAYLSRAERQRAVRVAVECLGGKRPLFVGVGALRTDEAQALAADAREAGADGLLLAPMSYTPLMEEEVFQHMVAVAEAGSLPLCIYNNPGTTKFTFSEDLIVRLSKVPNIVAVKMPLPPDGDFAGELVRLRARLPEGFAIGYSGDWGAADALLAGCDAWYSVVAGLLPEPALRLARAARRRTRRKSGESMPVSSRSGPCSGNSAVFASCMRWPTFSGCSVWRRRVPSCLFRAKPAEGSKPRFRRFERGFWSGGSPDICGLPHLLRRLTAKRSGCRAVTSAFSRRGQPARRPAHGDRRRSRRPARR